MNAIACAAPATECAPKARGIELFERSEWEKALIAFDEALISAGTNPTLHNYRARTLDALGRPAEALQAIDRALELQPGNVADLRNRGVLLRKLGRPAEALANFEAVLAVRPNDLDLLLKRTQVLNEIDRREEALVTVDRALSLYPQDLNALNARGMVLENLGRYGEALALFERMLALNPRSIDGINNCGLVQARQGHWQEALALYERSLALDPDQPQAHYNRSIVKLALGDWKSGLAEFECRWNAAPLKGAKPKLPTPLWLGQEPVEGRTIFVYHEQGYGDTLQCGRYVPRLIERGAKVILAVPPALVRLMRTLPGHPTVVSLGDPVPAHDLHCPMMSVLLAFGTTPTTIPTAIAYLQADPIASLHMRGQLGPARALRIGIAWSGRRYAPINYPRDLALAQLAPLLAMEADFVSLQREMSDADRQLLPTLTRLRTEPIAAAKDFADTAALISQLDLVISVDSAVAHLAGALGKPVWLLNRYASCWRWGQQGANTSWYPNMHVFRQKGVGDWTIAVREVCTAVSELVRRAEIVGATGSPLAKRGASVDKARANIAFETIRVVTATRLSQRDFFSKSALGRSLKICRGYPRNQRLELRLFAENHLGLPAVYNQAIREAERAPAILVLVHDDVYLTDFHWTERLLDGLQHFEIVGLAGTRRRVPRQPSWMFLDEEFKIADSEYLSGVVGHGAGFPDLKQLSVYGESGQEVKLLDGVLLAARSRTLTEHGLRFDPIFEFHFYDLDLCRQAELRGLKMGTWPIAAIHESGGRFGSRGWQKAYGQYLEKYGND